MFYKLFLMLALVLTPVSATALSLQEAQTCADKVLQAYNTKEYPSGYLDEVALIRSAYGPVIRSLSTTEVKQALDHGLRILKESFTDPSGDWQYDNVRIASVSVYKSNNIRAEGTMFIESRKHTGTVNFYALSRPGSCLIYQVRIEEIYTLHTELRKLLRADRQARKVFGK